VTEAGPGADGEVDMSSIGPLTLHVDRILEEATSGRSVLVEVIAEPSKSGTNADSWAISGWPIRCEATTPLLIRSGEHNLYSGQIIKPYNCLVLLN
jgi:hypothetical protein